MTVGQTVYGIVSGGRYKILYTYTATFPDLTIDLLGVEDQDTGKMTEVSTKEVEVR